MLHTELDAEQRSYAEIAKSSGEALLDLVSDIFDFSKIEAGKLELEIVTLNLHDLVENTVTMLGEQARAKRLELLEFVDPRIPVGIQGDPSRLQQVLINFATNAIKFTDAGEVVIRADLLETTTSGVHVRLSVRDTGPGIPRDRHDRLFKSFSQLDASTTRKHGGSGLGLAICNQIVSLMEGEIGVESDEGNGTTFWIKCHFRSADGLPASHIRPSAERQPGRALIISENRATSEILKESLRAVGLAVVAVDNKDAAIYALIDPGVSAPFTVVLIDEAIQSFPKAQLIPYIRRSPRAAGARVIALATTESAAGEQAIEAADVRLRKPIRQSQLVEAVLKQSATTKSIAASGSMQRSERPRSGRPARILVAEDNEINQIVTTQVLSKVGFECDLATNGREALEALRTKTYDLILMDCQMPEMDGFEATKRFRLQELEKGQAGSKQLPIIALTANALCGDRERCIEAGMSDYLTKPIDPVKLIDLIQHYLNDAIAN